MTSLAPASAAPQASLPVRTTPWLFAALWVLFALAAWAATSPTALAVINWDQGVYIANFASGKGGWSSVPWNAHFGIGHVYFLAAEGARRLGGTVIDGFRALNAVCFGLAAAILFGVAARLSRSRLLGILLTLSWATFWTSAIFVITLEDNILYLPAVAALISLLTRHADDWRPRDSWLAGLYGGLAALVSWQVIGHLAMVAWAAVLAPAAAPAVRERLLRLLRFGGTFVGTLLGWCVVASIGSALPVRRLVQVLFSNPYAPFPQLPVTPVWAVGSALVTLGEAAGRLFGNRYLFDEQKALPVIVSGTIGFLFLAVIVAIFVWATRTSRRLGERLPHVLAAGLLLYTVLLAYYRDDAYRYIVRFDYVPMLLLPLAAWVAPRLPTQRAHRALVAGVAVLALAQFTLAWRWDVRVQRMRPSLPSYVAPNRPALAWYGREGKTWFAYFRGLKRANPQACAFLFRLEEFDHGNWNSEVLASLWSELPNYSFIGYRGAVALWRFQPPIVTQDQAKHLLSCAWLSADAARLFGR